MFVMLLYILFQTMAWPLYGLSEAIKIGNEEECVRDSDSLTYIKTKAWVMTVISVVICCIPAFMTIMATMGLLSDLLKGKYSHYERITKRSVLRPRLLHNLQIRTKEN
jgi:hypothetical protein